MRMENGRGDFLEGMGKGFVQEVPMVDIFDVVERESVLVKNKREFVILAREMVLSLWSRLNILGRS